MTDGSESTIICVDNSDYNINEDIYPDRFISLRDSLNIICENKILSLDHHVGVLLMAGERCKILVALTNSLGKLLNCIHNIQIDGTCDIIKSLSIAQLVLKHRSNRNAHQKIVLLLGSPCTANEKQLMNVAKQLKKNNIGIEIVNYGCTSTNRDMLKQLYENVNNNNNSKYIEIPEDTTNISSFILSAFSNHTYCTYDDMNVNPDIFNAVRDSLREDTAAHVNTSNPAGAAVNVTNTRTNADRPNDMPTMEEIENMQDIDSDLREALLLSLREYNERQQGVVEETAVVSAETSANGPHPENTQENADNKNEANLNNTSTNTNVGNVGETEEISAENATNANNANNAHAEVDAQQNAQTDAKIPTGEDRKENVEKKDRNE